MEIIIKMAKYRRFKKQNENPINYQIVNKILQIKRKKLYNPSN